MLYSKGGSVPKHKILELDFEFNQSQNSEPNLVCLSARDRDAGWVKSFWLHNDDQEKAKAADFLRSFKETHIFLGYAIIAEARAMLTLGIKDVADYKWLCNYVLWRQATNHNHHFQYGKQLIDGKEVRTFPPKPKYEQTEQDKKANNSKAQHSMAAAAYKLLGVKVDTDRKNYIRGIIIRGNPEEIEAHKDEIIEYCESDLDYLKPMLVKLAAFHKSKFSKEHAATMLEDWLYLSEYAARTAIIEQLGYPVDVQATKNFADSVPTILKDIQMEINELFPEIQPFRYNKRTTKTHNANTFSWDQKKTKAWITTLDKDIQDGWVRTKTGDYSLSLDAFTKYFNFRHSFPKDNFGAQIVRYLKAKQQLNGFMPTKSGKKNFFDSLGDDGRSRPFLGIYGSQSSRNQPSSTGFLFLKSAYMRALCVPPRGKMICAIDYGSEEFLIGAIESGDKVMLRGYESGDPYLSFAKEAKAVPMNATEKSHGKIRDKFKSTTLGVSYLMGAKSLALKLTADTGEYHSEEDAQELIDLFAEVHAKYDEFRNEVVEEYQYNGYLMLADGWTMFGDNDNYRSVSNCPVQGMGGVILRRAVKYCQEAGLDVIITLHDALYCEMGAYDFKAVDLFADCMFRAFKDCFEGYELQDRANIRLDANVWGLDLDVGKTTTPKGMEIKTQKIYIDKRAVEEYETFSPYFKNNMEYLNDLL